MIIIADVGTWHPFEVQLHESGTIEFRWDDVVVLGKGNTKQEAVADAKKQLLEILRQLEKAAENSECQQ